MFLTCLEDINSTTMSALDIAVDVSYYGGIEPVNAENEGNTAMMPQQRHEIESTKALLQKYNRAATPDEDFDPTPDPNVDGYYLSNQILPISPLGDGNTDYHPSVDGRPIVYDPYTTNKGRDGLTRRDIWDRKTRPEPTLSERNQALALARATNFENHVKNLRWPDEPEEMFMVKVEAAVEHFAPKTRWKLFELINIIDLQLKIERIIKAQTRVMETTERVQESNGLSKGLNRVTDVEVDLDRLRKSLEAAKKSYYN